MIEAVIFDMDGLMVDTEPLSRQAWDMAIRPFGHSLDDTTYSRMVGLRGDESVQIVRQTFDLPLTAAALYEQKSAHYRRLRAEGIPVMPGLWSLLDAIEARHLPWAVATSSPRAQAEEVLGQLDLLSRCRAIVGGDEAPRGKPAPDIYLLAAERLNVAPNRCLALEDSLPGSQAAVAAGMSTVVVPNGPPNGRSPADFPHAHYVLSRLHEVIPLLANE
ncbi:MAG: HAD family phosphatase [Chloroflexota bacterium]